MSLDQGMRYNSGFNYHNQYLPQDHYGGQLSSFQVSFYCIFSDFVFIVFLSSERTERTEPEQAAERSS